MAAPIVQRGGEWRGAPYPIIGIIGAPRHNALIDGSYDEGTESNG